MTGKVTAQGATLVRARSNLIRARSRPEGVMLDYLCFDALQAAENVLLPTCAGPGAVVNARVEVLAKGGQGHDPVASDLAAL